MPGEGRESDFRSSIPPPLLFLLQPDFGRQESQPEDFGISSGSEEQMEDLNTGV